jgi:caa(3)-type oxidase subunit IV
MSDDARTTEDDGQPAGEDAAAETRKDAETAESGTSYTPADAPGAKETDHMELAPVAAHASGEDHSVFHVLPPGVYYATLGALLVLTVVTVGAAQFDFGAANIWIAMAIAGTKATVVAMFFMHLKYSNRFNSIVFASGILFLAIFLAFTMVDTETRHWYPEMTEITQPGMPGAR